MNDFAKKQTSQNSPVNPAISSESLEAMSPVELAEALELALDSMTEETYDPAVIDAYLDALDRKAPMPPAPDTEAAFQDFQRKLQSLSFEDKPTSGSRDSPAPSGKGRAFRRMVVSVATAAALLFTLMIGAQAAGTDIFGHLARWTDEHLFFIFSSGGNARNIETHDLFYKALKEHDLPTELAPGWYPEGFTPELKTMSDESSSDKSVWLTFTNERGDFFDISVDQYGDIENVQMLIEKDAKPVETYTKSGRTFYIYSNINVISAVSADGNLMVSIGGDLTSNEVKRMINSMGGIST